jgi:hypothetical protein
MNSKALRRKAITIANSRWATYAVAGAASSLAVATAEAEIHYSGPVNFHFTGTGGENFPLDNGASLGFDHIDEGGGKGRAHLYILNPNGLPSFENFAADGGRESSVSGFYLFRVAPQKQVSQLPMERSCRTTSTSSNLRCYGATIGLASLSGCHWKRPGNGFIAFVFDAGAGNEYGWARIKTTGALMYDFILVDYAWADPGDSIRTGQKSSQEVGQAVWKSGSLGLLATGATGLKAWREHKQAVVPQ